MVFLPISIKTILKAGRRNNTRKITISVSIIFKLSFNNTYFWDVKTTLIFNMF